MDLRTPPHSDDAEQAVLGCLLLSDDAWLRIGALGEADFYRHDHRLLYATMQALWLTDQPVDEVTVLVRLPDFDRAYLAALATCVPSAAHAPRYAEIVREKAEHRRLIAAAEAAANAAWADDVTLEQRRDAVHAALQTTLATAPAALPLAQVVESRLRRHDDIAAGHRVAGWPTQIPTLDGALGGGIEPGRIVVLAGRPGGGKSSLAATLAWRMAAAGKRTLIVSLEMPAGEIVDRMLASTGDLLHTEIRTGRIDDSHRPLLDDAAQRLSALPLEIVDRVHSLAGVVAEVRRRRGLQVLVVDYLQLVRIDGKFGNRNSEIEHATRLLKQIAIEADIAVVLLSQLNRSVEDRPDQRPRLSDLRDSGAIEQDADIVLMLWRASDLPGRRRLVGLAVEKARDGRTCEFALEFDPCRHQWRESTDPLPDNRRQRPSL